LPGELSPAPSPVAVHIAATIVAVTTTTAAACGHGDFGRIDERVRQLEGREEKQDEQIGTLASGQAGIREELAGMRGEIRGALAASKVSGAVIGSLVSLAGSGAIALLLFLLKGGR
jgi:hypothetical protein